MGTRYRNFRSTGLVSLDPSCHYVRPLCRPTSSGLPTSPQSVKCFYAIYLIGLLGSPFNGKGTHGYTIAYVCAIIAVSQTSFLDTAFTRQHPGTHL